MPPRILYVSGFRPDTRARDLAYEFEKFGRLIRCDVPAPRHGAVPRAPYAFIEFRNDRDAEDAYYDMHGKSFDGSRLSVQWAKNPPSSAWRQQERRRSPTRSRRDSPPRREREKERERDAPRRRSRSREGPWPSERETRRRSRSPEPSRDEKRRRSASPVRTPPRGSRAGEEQERPQSPPYDH